MGEALLLLGGIAGMKNPYTALHDNSSLSVQLDDMLKED
jgi:hypothetical protein